MSPAKAVSSGRVSGMLGLWLGAAASLVVASWDSAAAWGQPAAEGPPVTVWDEPAQLLVPRTARSEADQDQLVAASHFAQARYWAQRSRADRALRHFQRAWRYCPARAEWLSEIVSLAGQQRRYAEAIRYAVLAAERKPDNPPLVIQLAAHLSEQGQTERAVRLLQNAITLHGNQPPTLDYLAMQVEYGRLAHLLSQDQQAASALLVVLTTLRDSRNGLTSEERSQLLAQAELLYELVGDCFLRVGNADQALIAYRLANAVHPNLPLWSYRQAEVAWSLGKLEEVRKQLQRYFSTASNTAGQAPYRLLEKIHQRESDNPALARQRLLLDLQRLVAEQPANRPLALFQAEQFRREGDAEQAELIYVRLLREQPSLEVLQGWFDAGFESDQPAIMLDALAMIYELSGTLDGLEAQRERLLRHPARLERFLEYAQALKPATTNDAAVKHPAPHAEQRTKSEPPVVPPAAPSSGVRAEPESPSPSEARSQPTSSPSTAGPSTAGLSTAGLSTAGLSTAGLSTAGPSIRSAQSVWGNWKPVQAVLPEQRVSQSPRVNFLAMAESVDAGQLEPASAEAAGGTAQAAGDRKPTTERLSESSEEGLSEPLVETGQTDPAALPISIRWATAVLIALEADAFGVAADLTQRAIRHADEQALQRLNRSLALNWLVSRQPEAAVPLLKQAIAGEAETVRRFSLLLALATAQARANCTAEALQAVAEAAALQPASPRWLARQAWVHYQAQDWKAAETDYLKLLAQFDQPPVPPDGDQAEPVIEADDELRELLREARMMLAHLCQATLRAGEAERWLEEVLDEFPEDPGANNDLGYLWVEQRRHLRRGLNMIELAVQAEPENAAYRDSLGWAHYQLGHYAQAVQQLERAVKAEPNDGMMLDHLGDAYWKNGQVAQARDAWNKALQRFVETQAGERQTATRKKLTDSFPKSNSM